MSTKVKKSPASENEDRTEWLEEEIVPVLTGRAMTPKVEDMSISEVADSWQVLDLLRDAIEARQKDLRAILLSAAERDGLPTEKGGSQLNLNGAKIERQRRQTSEPEQKDMLALISQRKIELGDVYDEVKALVFNPSKVKYLVDTGKLSEEEVDALKKIQFALRIFKSDDWTGLFEQVLKKTEKKVAMPRPRFTR